MYSSRKATIIFVAILLLFLLSFVSAELNKRDPQNGGAGGGGGGAPPAGGGGGGNQPPAAGGGGGDAAPPAGGAGGGNQPPAAGGGGGNAAPPAGGAGGGKQPAAAPPAGGAGGGNQPGGGAAAPPAAGGDGGNNPSPAGNPPGPAGGGGGNNPSPAGNPPGPAGGGGGNPTGANPTNGTVPKYVDPSVQPLQVQMIEPKSAKNIIYKIGTNITFKWNYSDNGRFQDPPQVVVVQAELVQTDSKIKTFYPIQNLTLVANSTQVAFWNTAAEQSLPMSEYKLWISDQDGPNSPPKPGGLLTFSGLQFGLYNSQDTGTFCAACSNAISIPMISLSSIIGVALVTVASFNLISI